MDEKLKQLREKYLDEESQSQIADWEKSIKVSALTSNLENNDAFRLLIARFSKEMERLQKGLQEDETLFSSEDGRSRGQLMHARIKFIKDFLAIFSRAKSALQNFNNTLDKTLENNEN